MSQEVMGYRSMGTIIVIIVEYNHTIYTTLITCYNDVTIDYKYEMI